MDNLNECELDHAHLNTSWVKLCVTFIIYVCACVNKGDVRFLHMDYFTQGQGQGVALKAYGLI